MLDRKARPIAEILDETPGLKVNGDWVCININPRTSWPVRAQQFTFEGHPVWVMPLTTENYPGLAINMPAGMDRDDALALLHRALSLLAWLQDTGAVVQQMSGGNLPQMVRTRESLWRSIREDFDLSDLPVIDSDAAKLALALVREGRGLNHSAYSFLSFFRALEVAIPNGRERGDWITANIDKIPGHTAQAALQELKAMIEGDVGKHLRESGRHAIAHAKANPIINPDDPRDAQRLQGELPIIEALAVLAMEQHFGIQTSQRMRQGHLYELHGWKLILPPEVIAESLKDDPADLDIVVDLPLIDLRQRLSERFPMLERMSPVEIGIHDRRVVLTYRSTDDLIDLVFGLNFAEERLEFDLAGSLIPFDNGKAAAARNGRERCRFLWDYFGNGELQFWNSDTDELISRVDAFIPLNMWGNLDAHNAEMATWDKFIADREAAAQEAIK